MEETKKSHWHTEYYARRLAEIAETTGQHCHDGNCKGWEAWFKENHAELYEKYKAALERVGKLWGDMSKVDDFKKAVEIEVQAYAFAIPKYIAARREVIA